MRRYLPRALLLAVVLGCSLTSCGQTRSAEIASPRLAKVVHEVQSPHTNGVRPDRPKASRPTRSSPHAHRCRAVQVRLSVALSASAMSQPFDDISVTNSGATPCVLTGYPRIAVMGHRGWPGNPAPLVHVGICVHHGLYERVDPGSHRVVVPPQHRVFFSIGTADAYDGPLFTLTRLTVILPGTGSPKVLAITLFANGPPGRRIPVGLTAVDVSPHA
jgi:hypothetical protein